MEPQPKNQIGEILPTTNPPQDPTALEIIRTETVLSKLPVHNLAKKGRVDIQILKTTPDGNVELKWEVSYNERYGQARQLAYKLDTIVIDRRIEEQGRPLPERLSLGSLRDIADQLQLGGDTNKVRRALRQNASAFITAKFKYRGNDGSERKLEADFTRYSVVFTGEKFPDGTRADAVYLLLNNPYREVLNNAPVRPLDLAYKKQLAPAPQRFYEIVSYKIFTSLKYSHPTAKLAYSEYCTFSAQQRYFEREQFRKQMFKIHRPHLASGYIEHVDYEPTADQQGSADWIMCYVPGPKARAEYETFTGKRPRIVSPPATEAGERPHHARTPRQKSLKLQPQADPELVAMLRAHGIAEEDAHKLLAETKPGQLVRDQIEYFDFLVNREPEKQFGTGLLVSFVRKDIPIPDNRGFISSRQQKEHEAARQAKEELAQKLAAAEQTYNAYVKTRLETHLQTLPAGEYERLITSELDTLMRQHPFAVREAMRYPAETAVRRTLIHQLHLPTLEQWKRQLQTAPPPPAAIIETTRTPEPALSPAATPSPAEQGTTAAPIAATDQAPAPNPEPPAAEPRPTPPAISAELL